MATKIFMEALSPTMEEGRVVKWNKNEGDAVKSGDSLAEVETDKAIMELVARGDGVLRKRLVAEGESRPVGTLLGVIGTADENIDALVGSAGASGGGAAAPAAAPANATVAQTKETPAASPIPQRPQQSQGEASTPPQQKLGDRGAQPTGAGNGQQQTPPNPPQHDGPVRSSTLARRMARERGVELSGVAGSGPGGRIIRRDIEGAMTSGAAQAQAGISPKPGPKPRPAREGDFQDVALTQIRKTI